MSVFTGPVQNLWGGFCVEGGKFSKKEGNIAFCKLWKLLNWTAGKPKFFLPFTESCHTIKCMVPAVDREFECCLSGSEFEEYKNERWLMLLCTTEEKIGRR